ncbi:PdaC/SigV domain-containing protein [Paenibacillus nasutitermitis]|uniref:Copper amine oxidase N-terminal domain-containing protein n=1 Tax=Paenibacillus nasutitermitis TaxID=1652958 RepID=A0A917DQN0_9BACL|nr:DUF4163 domain-containing protein [Paenibacillus nasutitermitis]GGD59958.1 hypothetical protein GCM10010911_17280 [Paenibacillus nasutitermitis]
MKNTHKKRKVLPLVLATAILASPMAMSFSDHTAAAASSKFKIIEQPFRIEGLKKSIGTINNDSSTYIALRSLNTALGLVTDYNKATQTVKITGNGRLLEINLKNQSITLNNQLIFGPPLIVQDNTTYLPLRFLLERMGYEISYENDTKLIGMDKISENDLRIRSEVIGADGDGKSLSVYYPVISGYENSEVQQKINAFLKQQADKHVADGSKEMNAAVQENNKILAKDPKATVRQPSLDGRYTVTANENGKLSLYVDYYIDMGGAHGITSRVPYTFDLTTGNLLSLKDVVEGNANYISIINNKINEQIKSRKLPLLTPFKTIEADRDYFLNHNGVVIYFTQYEYTSYAEGMPEFVIPYSNFK